MRIICGHTISELVEIRFAEDDRARFLEFGDDVSVVFWNKFLQKFRTGSCPDSGVVNVVFKRNRNAMQWATIASGFLPAGQTKFCFGLSCLGECVFCRDGKVGVQFWIEAFDALEEVVGQ